MINKKSPHHFALPSADKYTYTQSLSDKSYLNFNRANHTRFSATPACCSHLQTCRIADPNVSTSCLFGFPAIYVNTIIDHVFTYDICFVHLQGTDGEVKEEVLKEYSKNI
jgi:hypothetical protein